MTTQTTSDSKPWEEMGISRTTYYRIVKKIKDIKAKTASPIVDLRHVKPKRKKKS